jgi:hypothetical protein
MFTVLPKAIMQSSETLIILTLFRRSHYLDDIILSGLNELEVEYSLAVLVRNTHVPGWERKIKGI